MQRDETDKAVLCVFKRVNRWVEFKDCPTDPKVRSRYSWFLSPKPYHYDSAAANPRSASKWVEAKTLINADTSVCT